MTEAEVVLRGIECQWLCRMACQELKLACQELKKKP